MHAAGHLFFLSDNGVWLTDSVPPEYLVADERSDDDGEL
jgi:putative RNA 2'-phosphotransferase